MVSEDGIVVVAGGLTALDGVFGVAAVTSGAGGLFVSNPRTLLRILEFAGVTLAVEGPFADCTREGLALAEVEVEEAGLDVGVVVLVFAFAVAAMLFVERAALEALAVGGVDDSEAALVDFCRVVLFWTGSGFSSGIGSETAFFGLPLFLTTSDVDIVASEPKVKVLIED